MLGTKEKDSHSSARPHAHTTALFWASLKGFHSIARMLLIAGANAYHTRSVGSIWCFRIINNLIESFFSRQDGATPLSVAKDEQMKRLIRAYQAGARLFSGPIFSLYFTLLPPLILQAVLPGWCNNCVHLNKIGLWCVTSRTSY